MARLPAAPGDEMDIALWGLNQLDNLPGIGVVRARSLHRIINKLPEANLEDLACLPGGLGFQLLDRMVHLTASCAWIKDLRFKGEPILSTWLAHRAEWMQKEKKSLPAELEEQEESRDKSDHVEMQRLKNRERMRRRRANMTEEEKAAARAKDALRKRRVRAQVYLVDPGKNQASLPENVLQSIETLKKKDNAKASDAVAAAETSQKELQDPVKSTASVSEKKGHSAFKAYVRSKGVKTVADFGFSLHMSKDKIKPPGTTTSDPNFVIPSISAPHDFEVQAGFVKYAIVESMPREELEEFPETFRVPGTVKVMTEFEKTKWKSYLSPTASRIPKNVPATIVALLEKDRLKNPEVTKREEAKKAAVQAKLERIKNEWNKILVENESPKRRSASDIAQDETDRRKRAKLELPEESIVSDVFPAKDVLIQRLPRAKAVEPPRKQEVQPALAVPRIPDVYSIPKFSSIVGKGFLSKFSVRDTNEEDRKIADRKKKWEEEMLAEVRRKNADRSRGFRGKSRNNLRFSSLVGRRLKAYEESSGISSESGEDVDEESASPSVSPVKRHSWSSADARRIQTLTKAAELLTNDSDSETETASSVEQEDVSQSATKREEDLIPALLMLKQGDQLVGETGKGDTRIVGQVLQDLGIGLEEAGIVFSEFSPEDTVEVFLEKNGIAGEMVLQMESEKKEEESKSCRFE